jgi:hypothetical protein
MSEGIHSVMGKGLARMMGLALLSLALSLDFAR